MGGGCISARWRACPLLKFFLILGTQGMVDEDDQGRLKGSSLDRQRLKKRRCVVVRLIKKLHCQLCCLTLLLLLSIL